MGQVLTQHEVHDYRLLRNHQRVVLATGVFDVIHPGHMNLLEKAKAMGDVLIVGINDDITVKDLKGNGRPIITAKDRAIILSYIVSVDVVTIFTEPTACELIAAIRPDVFVKGMDYLGKDIAELQVLVPLQIAVAYVPLLPGYSTTAVVEKKEAGNYVKVKSDRIYRH